jgi:hypothetical protein
MPSDTYELNCILSGEVPSKMFTINMSMSSNGRRVSHLMPLIANRLKRDEGILDLWTHVHPIASFERSQRIYLPNNRTKTRLLESIDQLPEIFGKRPDQENLHIVVAPRCNGFSISP